MESYHHSLFFRRMLAYIVLVLLAILSLAPFLILILNSSHSHPEIMKGFSIVPGSWFFKNIGNLIGNGNIPIMRAMGNSLLVSICTAVLSTYFSAMTAYGIHMYRFKGRDVAFKFIMAIMMIPTQVTTLGFLKLLGVMNLMDSLFPLIITTIAAPVVFFYMLQYMESTVSISIVEAARIDGCGEFRTFNEIVLPLLKPAIAVQAIFAFVSSWNNYFLPALIIDSNSKKTIPILIAQLRSADYSKFDMGQVYMQVCFAIVPLLIIYLILSRYIISGVALGGVKE